MASPENLSSGHVTVSPKKSWAGPGGCLQQPATFLLLLLAVFELVTAWNDASHHAGIDFYQFWAVGQSLGSPGLGNIYSDTARENLGVEFLEKAVPTGDDLFIAAAQRRPALETYSSPFLYSVFGAFSTSDYETDFRHYRLLLLACLVFGIGVFCRLFGYSLPIALGAIAVFSSWFEPFASDLRNGNVTSVQLALLAAYFLVVSRQWRYRDILGGAILGIAVIFKPNVIPVPAVLALQWIFSRDWQRLRFHAIGGAAGGIAAILFAAIRFKDFHCWIDWISTLYNMPHRVITLALGNSSPVELFLDLFGVNLAIPVAIIFCGLTVALLWIRNRKIPRANASHDMFAVAIGCLLIVLISRLTWLFYYVLTIPTFLFLLRPIDTRPGGVLFIGKQLLPVLALALIESIPIIYLFTQVPLIVQSIMIVSGPLLLFLGLVLSPFPLPGSKNVEGTPASVPQD